MTTDDLLRATRDVYVLALKPGSAAGIPENSWSMKIGGLSQEQLRQAGVVLRKAHLAKANTKPMKEALKPIALLDSLARALGAESYDRWIGEEQEKIVSFLAEHGMTHPTDLIGWALPPGFARALTGQQVSDRLFNSGLALPKRIFTGIGSFLFAPSIGRNDVSGIAQRDVTCNEKLLDFCSQHADEVLMRAEHMRRDDAPPYIDLTPGGHSKCSTYGHPNCSTLAMVI